MILAYHIILIKISISCFVFYFFTSEAIERTSRAAGAEAAAGGIHWTLAPSADVARDARWGRVVEGAGEDPFLCGLVAAAQVKGLQGGGEGPRPVGAESIMACVKHLAAYG